MSSSSDPTVNPQYILSRLASALMERKDLLGRSPDGAVRLFNGFTEGYPGLVVDLFARTLVIADHADRPDELLPALPAIQGFYLERMPWMSTVILKVRHGQRNEARWGKVVYGLSPDQQIMEHGIWYAIDLLLNQDTSFYIDTRNLRRWLIDHMAGKSVLNTFAYTGSLGVAAVAAGARQVTQLDRSEKYLNLAHKSCTLNGFASYQNDYLVGDFWSQVARLKQDGRLFDCALLDPPFFASSRTGIIDLQRESVRLINKVRPLVSHDGYLVAVNNALYLTGSEYIRELERLCESGYLSIESLIPIPEDITGYQATRQSAPPVDPAPFNHPTKIAVLRVKRKDGRMDL